MRPQSAQLSIIYAERAMANYNASLLHESINLNKSTIRDTDAGHIWSSYIVKLHARLSDANTIDWEIGQKIVA